MQVHLKPFFVSSIRNEGIENKKLFFEITLRTYEVSLVFQRLNYKDTGK